MHNWLKIGTTYVYTVHTTFYYGNISYNVAPTHSQLKIGTYVYTVHMYINFVMETFRINVVSNKAEVR